MRRLLLTTLPLAAFAVIAACSSGGDGSDTGSFVEPAGGDGGTTTTGTDASVPSADGGSTTKDSGTTPTDAGSDSGSDAGSDAGIKDAGADAAPTTYAIKATVSGLSGAGLVLQNNAGDDLAVAQNGTATFTTKEKSGDAYAVTVKTQPTSPWQTCVVTNGSGNVAAADVTATVTCTTNAYKVKGSVSGLLGTVVLQDNAADDLSITQNGAFEFVTPVASGMTSTVTIKTQPANQTCSLTNAGPNAVTNADITNVAVTCKTAGPGDELYYFPLDGNGKDWSGGGHDLTIVGGSFTDDRNGNANRAMLFDTNTYASALGDALPIGNAARTLTFWMRPDNGNGQWGIVYWGKDDCTGLMFGLGRQNGTNTFWGGCNDVQSTATAQGQWSFVAVVFTPPNQIRMWTNGASQDYTIGNPDTHASHLWLGGETTNDANFRNAFTGALDDVRVFGRALTDAEIQAVYTLP